MFNPWLIHINVWQKPLQYYKVICLQLTLINFLKKKKYIYIFKLAEEKNGEPEVRLIMIM